MFTLNDKTILITGGTGSFGKRPRCKDSFERFSYYSGTNTQWLSVEDMKELNRCN